MLERSCSCSEIKCNLKVKFHNDPIAPVKRWKTPPEVLDMPLLRGDRVQLDSQVSDKDNLSGGSPEEAQDVAASSFGSLAVLDLRGSHVEEINLSSNT